MHMNLRKKGSLSRVRLTARNMKLSNQHMEKEVVKVNTQSIKSRYNEFYVLYLRHMLPRMTLDFTYMDIVQVFDMQSKRKLRNETGIQCDSDPPPETGLADQMAKRHNRLPELKKLQFFLFFTLLCLYFAILIAYI